MTNKEQAALYLKQLDAEAVATRKCLKRLNETTADFKPHPKSMPMGYLTQLVTEIPYWIQIIVEENEIDFSTFKHADFMSDADGLTYNQRLMKYFEQYLAGAKKALQHASEEQLGKPFQLKSGGEVIFSIPVIDYIDTTINHWVHHRGQLTVYMRLNNIEVPSIYGPSADDNPFKK